MEKITGKFAKYAEALVRGVLPDWPDPARKKAGIVEPRPTHCDHSDLVLPIWDQGNEGSCVSFMAQKYYESYMKLRGFMCPFTSRRFSYDLAKVKDDDEGLDKERYPEQEGTTLASCFWVMQAMGSLPEEDWPYTAGEFDPKDISTLLSYILKAQQRRILDYWTLEHSSPTVRLSKIQSSIYDTGFAGLGVPVTAGWFDPGPDGIIEEKGPILGYHAILGCGYDDGTYLLTFANSWSDQWGDKGFGRLRYESLLRTEGVRSGYRICTP